MKTIDVLKMKCRRQSVRLRLYKSRAMAIKTAVDAALDSDKYNREYDEDYIKDMEDNVKTDDSQSVEASRCSFLLRFAL
eukprot:7448534-Pyramimonas_sp.AAC.1